MIYLAHLLLFCLVIDKSSAIKCFQCRSDQQPDCGEPFNPYRRNMDPQECDNFFTQNTLACFKTKQYAAGHTIIIRGCAPFTSEVFSPAMARSIGGNYWRRSNVFSFCTHDECNRGSLATSTPSILLLLLLSALLARAAPVQL